MNDSIFFSFYNLAHKSDIFDKVIVFFAHYFIFLVVFSILIYLLLKEGRNFKGTLLVVFSGFSAWLLSDFIKELLKTDRPFVSFNDVNTLVEGFGYAFPSGHTTPLAALAFAVFFLNKKAGYVFMICALLVGTARVIAGVHFPVDILGGFILGALVAYFVKFISNKIYKKS